MHARRGPSRRVLGSRKRILCSDPSHSHRPPAGFASACLGVAFDLRNEFRDSLPIGVGVEMRPARKRRENHFVILDEVIQGNLGAATARIVELRSIEPGASIRPAGEQRSSTVDTRPRTGGVDKSLFATVRQEVVELPDLCGLLVADENGVVTTVPDRRIPFGQSADLARSVGIDVTHEARELLGVGWAENEVEVVGKKGVTVDGHAGQELSPTEDAEGDLIDSSGWRQEEARLHRPACDLDNGTWWGIAQFAWHH